jgi:signal transduction histidine kinase/CheY-like chemotaxis protein
MAEMIGYKDIPSLTSVPMERIFKNHEDYEMLVRRIQEECDIQDLQLILTNQKTGKDVETNVSITCQTDAKGDYEYSEAFIVDITHITELEKRLLHAQKMEAIGTLAGGIAHDFNNILTVMAGRIQLLAMAPAVQDDEKLNEHLLEMEKSVKRAGNLVSQILGFARKGLYRADALHLNKVAQEVRSLLGETIDRRIVISLELTPKLLPIKGDEEQIFQSLLNICLNSCDAMPDGGELTVKTGVLVSKEEVSIIDQVMPPGKYVFLEVDDTGSGIDKETISKVFDPFFTTKDVGKGTGLGMAMVHGIVSNHGGYLNVESLGGRGTTVTIYFPPILEEEKDQDLESVEREVQEGVSQQGDTAYSVPIKDDPAGDQNILARDPGKAVPETKSDLNDLSSWVKGEANTVLLVDDEETILKMNQAFFSAVEGYDLFTASSGEEAIEIIKKYRESIDIVVLDISMPGMGGGKAFRVIHELFPDLPVIVATGHARDETVNSMLEGGAVDLILKPYMGLDLLEALNTCCSKRG